MEKFVVQVRYYFPNYQEATSGEEREVVAESAWQALNAVLADLGSVLLVSIHVDPA